MELLNINKSAGDTLSHNEVNNIVTAINSIATWINNYEAQEETNYKDVSYAIVNGLKEKYVYDGENEIIPYITLFLNGKRLNAGEDYIVDYYNNNAVGTGTILIRGIGECYGEKRVTFAIEGLKYTLSYDANGHGTAPSSTKVSVITSSEVPTLTAPGYDFLGWFDAPNEGQRMMSGFILTSEKTLYAHWQQSVWQLTKNGKDIINNSTSQVSELSDDVLAAPNAVEGYWFIGWFMDENCTQPCSLLSDKKLYADTTIYAKFINKEVVLNVNDGLTLTATKTDSDANASIWVKIGSGSYEEYTSAIALTETKSYAFKLKYVNSTLGINYETEVNTLTLNYNADDDTIKFVTSVQYGTVTVTGATPDSNGYIDLARLTDGITITATDGNQTATIIYHA